MADQRSASSLTKDSKEQDVPAGLGSADYKAHKSTSGNELAGDMAAEKNGGTGQQSIEESSPSSKIPFLFIKTRKVAREIWLANLGAASLFEKNSKQFFNKLVLEGAEYKDVAKVEVEKKIRSVKQSAEAKIHVLENRLDNRINNTLHWAGVPSRQDFDHLAEKVNELSESLTTLTKQLKVSMSTEKAEH